MEFLICKVDIGSHQAGDIIDIHPDGFSWGTDELTSDRLQVVRLPTAEVGTVANARILYLPLPIYRCSVCDVYLETVELQAHIDAAHADEKWQDEGQTVQKSPEALGISVVFQCKFGIDISGKAIMEKKPDLGLGVSTIKLSVSAVDLV